MAEPIQQAVKPPQRIPLRHFGELAGIEAGGAEFDQSRRPIQPPTTLRHRLVDLGIGGVGDLGKPCSGLLGQVELGGGPGAHGPGPLGSVDLEPVQAADQRDLTGPDPCDLRFTGHQL